VVSKTLRTFAEDLAALGNLRASSRFALACKILHPATRPAERLHRGPATGIPTTGARDKQIAASVLSYHRQGPLLREGQERTKGEERACVRDERRTERERRERRTISITFKTLNAMINHSITARAVNPNLFEGSSFRPPTHPRPYPRHDEQHGSRAATAKLRFLLRHDNGRKRELWRINPCTSQRLYLFSNREQA